MKRRLLVDLDFEKTNFVRIFNAMVRDVIKGDVTGDWIRGLDYYNFVVYPYKNVHVRVRAHVLSKKKEFMQSGRLLVLITTFEIQA